MRRTLPRRFAGAVLLLVVTMVVSPRRALAHAVLLSSTPQKNAFVSGPVITINLKYNSRVDGARSTLTLLKPDGTIEKIGTPAQLAPDVLSATGRGLTKGSYVLRWQVLAGAGHITRGELPFQVQ
jgi:methionine-rich copper-binding protein CopC